MDWPQILFGCYFTIVWVAVVYDMAARRGIRSWPWIMVAIILGPMTLVPLLLIPLDPEHAQEGLWAP